MTTFKKVTRVQHSLTDSTPRTSNIQLPLAYVADLELEVDRLGKRGRFVRQGGGERWKGVNVLCAQPPGAGDPPAPLGEIDQAVRQLGAVLRELQEPPGYHPAHDQVVAIAVR